jgi:regulator of protease activity HflC (stomatin/prohibitin superfamily)
MMTLSRCTQHVAHIGTNRILLSRNYRSKNSRQIPWSVIQKRFSPTHRSTDDSDGVDIQTSSPLKLDDNRLRHFVVKVIPQGEVGILQRLGKFHRVMGPGLHFLIPLIDRIEHSYPLRRVSFTVTPQAAFTKDNVKVRLGGDIIVRVVDPKAAAYGANSPFTLATIYAQAAMRNAIGELTLDELLNQRERINHKVFEAVNKQTNPYGLECLGYEIKGLQVPQHIEEEMARQVTSERKRRETVLNSQGEREAAINKAEGLKISSQLSSEGQKIAQINEAEGNAQKRLIEARAEAQALELIGKAIRDNPEGASIRLANEALKAWEGMLGKSNTMVIPANVNPLEVLLPQALAAYTRSTDMLKETFKKDET